VVVVVVRCSMWWDRSFSIVAGPDAAVAQQCGLYDPHQHLFLATASKLPPPQGPYFSPTGACSNGVKARPPKV
jgi:hypothetical protein